MLKSGPTIAVNEFFGPTIQGEGSEVGRPCYFLRLHHCPVQCPGCDTAHTWNQTEKPKLYHYEMLRQEMEAASFANPGCGLVVSGGEPLIHHSNLTFVELLDDMPFKWTALETSGYTASELNWPNFQEFVRRFERVALSPKITPCLHGKQTDRELERNIPLFMATCDRVKLSFKFVVRDQLDLDAVEACCDRWGIQRSATYLMPYGNEKDEILAAIERLIPFAAKKGFIITPRLHSLLWGATRAK